MRDIRDPKELGASLLHPGLKASVQRHHGTMDVPLSEVYDYAEKRDLFHDVPDYSRTESTVDVTKALYQRQMIEQAEKGEPAAVVVCDEHGWAYVPSRNEVPDESVRKTRERACYDWDTHDPHVWSRVGEHGWESFTCTGVQAEGRNNGG